MLKQRLSQLSGLGDQLEAFSRTVDFEVFRRDLEQALACSDGSKGGRPPFGGFEKPSIFDAFYVIPFLRF